MEETELAALIESEREARRQAAHLGRTPDYPVYKHGPIIAAGTISTHGYHAYTDDGVRGAVLAAATGSLQDTLVHVAARRVDKDTDTIVCAFAGGSVIPLDEARRIAVNGYGNAS
jgi:hypothetical protein